MRRFRSVTVAAALVLAGVVAPPGSPAYAAPKNCADDYGSDYNGDGAADLAVADPYASVGQVSKAGHVVVLYGTKGGRFGSGGSEVLSQDSPGVPGAPETGDSFGTTLSSSDLDCDGYSDLVVGVPYEDAGSKRNAGVVTIIYGSAAGLDPATRVRQLDHGTFGATAAANDLFGLALDVTQDIYGRGPSYAPNNYAVAIGVPGRDVKGAKDAGAVAVLSPNLVARTINVQFLTQDSAGVPGAAEAGDRFGAAVALGNLTGEVMVVGAPGEDLGKIKDAGQVTEFVLGSPGFTGSNTFDQVQPNDIGSTAKAGNQFGASIDIAAARNIYLYLLVGIPGQDVGTAEDAGAVAYYLSGEYEGPGGIATLTQNSPGVSGSAEAGDRFGEKVALRRDGTAGFLLGLPHEDGSQADSGAFQVIPDPRPPTGVPGYTQNSPGIAGVSEAGDHFGESIAPISDASSSVYAIGVPDDVTYATGLVQVIPTDGTPYALIPGIDGVPGAGASRFGAAIALSGRDFPDSD